MKQHKTTQLGVPVYSVSFYSVRKGDEPLQWRVQLSNGNYLSFRTKQGAINTAAALEARRVDGGKP